jgi:hypothetical protein
MSCPGFVECLPMSWHSVYAKRSESVNIVRDRVDAGFVEAAAAFDANEKKGRYKKYETYE